MQIEIEGSRSSDAAWHQAHSIPVTKLRELTAQDVDWTNPDEAASVQLARRSYAFDLTQPELVAKCVKLGRLTSDWLRQTGLHGEVLLVRLRCLRGIFDVHVSEDAELHKIEVKEDVLDNLLQAGSRDAAESLDRLLASNFGRLVVSKAS
jgi:hypothetical protein